MGGDQLKAACKGPKGPSRRVCSSSGIVTRYKVATDFQDRAKRKTPFYRSPNLRLSLSLSTILLLHRLLYRFFTLLRENLLTDDARPFRVRNPRVSRALVSRLAPAIGSSLAGFMLGVYPSDQLRMTIAIYTLTRALEFLYNKLDDDGWLKDKPWWFGSWLIMPLASGQLLHAFVFDRDCFPKVCLVGPSVAGAFD